MIFSFGAGSAGEGEPSYVVRLPFRISPGKTLKLEEGDSFDLLGQKCEVTRQDDLYVLTIRGFDTEDAAAIFLAKVSAGLIWFGLKNSIGLRFSPFPTPVDLYNKPTPFTKNKATALLADKGWREIDGEYDPKKTTIIPDHKRLRVFRMGLFSLQNDMPVSILSEAMLEGIGDGCPELVPENSKLRLACEVYLSSHFEATPTATFLNLINTLEILVEDASSSESIKTMVQRFIVEAKTAEKGATSPEIRSEYHSLVSRLSYLRHRSIKSGIRSLIENGLQTDSSSKKAVEIAGEISRLYDLRSDLVHSGDVDKKDIANGNKRLNEVVPSILRVFFRRTAQRE